MGGSPGGQSPPPQVPPANLEVPLVRLRDGRDWPALPTPQSLRGNLGGTCPPTPPLHTACDPVLPQPLSCAQEDFFLSYENLEVIPGTAVIWHNPTLGTLAAGTGDSINRDCFPLHGRSPALALLCKMHWYFSSVVSILCVGLVTLRSPQPPSDSTRLCGQHTGDGSTGQPQTWPWLHPGSLPAPRQGDAPSQRTSQGGPRHRASSALLQPLPRTRRAQSPGCLGWRWTPPLPQEQRLAQTQPRSSPALGLAPARTGGTRLPGLAQRGAVFPLGDPPARAPRSYIQGRS